MEHELLKESKTSKEKFHGKLYYISFFPLVLCIHFSGTQPWPQSNPYSIMQLQHPTCCVYIFFLQFRYYFGWLQMFPLFCVFLKQWGNFVRLVVVVVFGMNNVLSENICIPATVCCCWPIVLPLATCWAERVNKYLVELYKERWLFLCFVKCCRILNW